MRLGAVAQVIQQGTQIAERFRVQLWTLPSEFERWWPGTQIRPLHRERPRTSVRKEQKDARATVVSQVLQEGERAAREWMEGVSDAHRISRRLLQ